MKKIFVWGVQWVWKSSIIKKISTRNENVWSFSYWWRLVEVAKKEISNYTNFDWLSGQQREIVLNIVKEQLNEILNKKNFELLLFDNHYTIFREWKIMDTFADKNILFYDKLLLISAKKELIANRIAKDFQKERVSIASKEDFLEIHQNKELERFHFLSHKYSIEFLEVFNNWSLIESVSKIESFMKL